MDDKLKLFSWKEAEIAWDKKALLLQKSHPLKVLQNLPSMPGVTPETARHLKFKSLKYLVKHDENRVIPRYFFKHPFEYGLRLIKSLLKKKSYQRQGDLFFYGVKNTQEFIQALENQNSHIVVGFSYCHKPHECPSGRFTTACIHDPNHPVCGQCFIGKSVHALPEKGITILFITTIHYIGEKIFEAIHAHPGMEILFLITACEMTLKMFSDVGNMVGVKGIGVRLDGRICNTMRAFELSEKGIKPGLTVVLDETQKQMLELIYHLRSLRMRSDTPCEKA
jgi:hypothetical protein